MFEYIKINDKDEINLCNAKPSKHSSVKCEKPYPHPPFSRWTHAGRTKGGYWKIWPVEDKAHYHKPYEDCFEDCPNE